MDGQHPSKHVVKRVSQLGEVSRHGPTLILILFLPLIQTSSTWSSAHTRT